MCFPLEPREVGGACPHSVLSSTVPYNHDYTTNLRESQAQIWIFSKIFNSRQNPLQGAFQEVIGVVDTVGKLGVLGIGLGAHIRVKSQELILLGPQV